MKGWYRRTAMKAVVLIVGVLTGAMFFTSLIVTTRLTETLNPAETVKLIGEPYEESSDSTLYALLHSIRSDSLYTSPE